VCYTIDAGPNVHVLTLADQAERVREKLSQINGVQTVIVAPVGEGASFVEG
jgi:diphosphomevalonate decarboxylase